jgi:hypothetical protein
MGRKTYSVIGISVIGLNYFRAEKKFLLIVIKRACFKREYLRGMQETMENS